MNNKFRLIVNIFLISISFSQTPCVLGEVYVSEAANQGTPNDYIEVYNGGSVECTLAGFQLDDTESLEDFTFGNVILDSGDYWLGYENAEESFSSGLGSGGDTVVFADPADNMLIITLEVSIEMADGIELSQSYGSDGEGCYTLPTPGESNENCFEFSCPAMGDLNGDGGYNVLDVVMLVNCVLANNCLNIENSCAGDLNGDSGYNVLDVVVLVNCVLANDCGDRVDDASHSSFQADYR